MGRWIKIRPNAVAARLTVFAAVIATVGSSAFAATHGGLASTRGGATIIVKYSGNGNKKLPPFRLSSGATLAWTNFRRGFLVDDDLLHVPVDPMAPQVLSGTVVWSEARRGSSYLTAGRHQLRISALGNWTITIRKASLAGSGVLRFKGNDVVTKLAAFKTGLHGANITWTNTGPFFALHDDAQDYFVADSMDPRTPVGRGTSYVGSGRHQFSVFAFGSWTVTVKPFGR